MQAVRLHLLLNTFGVLLILLPFNTGDNYPSCYQETSLNCSETLKNGKEKCLHYTTVAYCCNVTSEKDIVDFIAALKTNSRSIYGFHLRDSNISRLNINIFSELPNLVSLSITENNVSKIEGIFDNQPLKCVNISRNLQLSDISPQIIVKLKNLQNFVMSSNSISIVPYLPPRQSTQKLRLDVSENKQLQCKHLINLTVDVGEKLPLDFVNKHSTYCLPPNARIFGPDVAYMKFEILEKVKVILKDCPKAHDDVDCVCSIYSLDYSGPSDENPSYLYQVLVNCSNRQMTSLPKALPLNTRVLDISNNSITSFEGIGNKTYNTVRELYADNNKITTLKHLEGTSFLHNFQNLTVRNNKIDRIQEYMLSNVFDRNFGKFILLAKNDLKCDCHAASQTKAWLTANKQHVLDYDQIYAICDSPIKVLELESKDLCPTPHNWKDYIRYLIVLEITMFVLLIGKVSYDYYVFKTAGYLPWPASKMPKLPCDWCFEK